MFTSVFSLVVDLVTVVLSVETLTAIMGNVPLCIPKKGGPIVFTEGYEFRSESHTLPMKQYHPYEASQENLCSRGLPRSSLTSSTSFEEKRKRSLLMGEDTSVVGIEIDKDSVRLLGLVGKYYYVNTMECLLTKMPIPINIPI